MVAPSDIGTVDRIPDLEDLDETAPGTKIPKFTTVLVKGRWAAGDGGGGLFRWDPTNFTPGNFGTVFEWEKADSNTGRWLRVIEDERNYNFRWFGAKGNFRPIKAVVTITNNTKILTTNAAVFFSADVGRVIGVPGAGANGGVLAATVSGFTNGSTITLSDAALTSLNGVETTMSLGSDDTEYCQKAIDAAMAAGVGIEMSCGDYLVGPLKGNGSSWDSTNPDHKEGQQPSVLAFRGQGNSPFLCRLVAKPGAYNLTLKSVLTFRNVGGVTISGFQIDANNEAEVCGDFAWIGPTSDTVPEAPSCQNEFTSLWGENANRVGWNFDQAADCKISSVRYRGGTASVGMSLQLSGGGIWADNVYLSTNAKLLLACQNSGFQNCGFWGGVELTGQSMNYVHMDAVHFYPYTPKRVLRENPFSTSIGSKIVTVTMRSHGLVTGNFVEFSGVEIFAGITSTDALNTDRTPGQHPKADPFKITWLSDDQFTIQMASPAIATASGGGAHVNVIGRGYTIYSNLPEDQNGNYPSGSRSIVFTSCWFNEMGVYGQKYFAGRWMLGTRFVGCRLAFNAASKLVQGTPEDPLIYFDTDNWTATGADSLPFFQFDNCSFGTVEPASVEGKVLVGWNGRMNRAGIVVTEMNYPGNIKLTDGGFFQDTAADGITAKGTTQGDAAALTAGLNNVTVATAATGNCVRLPATVAGRKVLIWNNSGNLINVYPGVGSSINKLATNAPLTGGLADGQNRTFRAISATKWLTEG